VQGRLRGESLSFTIQTECAHCRETIKLEIDSELNYHVLAGGPNPLVHVPMVDVAKLEALSIIDGF